MPDKLLKQRVMVEMWPHSATNHKGIPPNVPMLRPLSFDSKAPNFAHDLMTVTMRMATATLLWDQLQPLYT